MRAVRFRSTMVAAVSGGMPALARSSEPLSETNGMLAASSTLAFS